jgi:hypothetical protein
MTFYVSTISWVLFFLKLVTTVIVLVSVFVRNCKFWKERTPFKGIFFFKESNPMSTNLTISLLCCNCCSTDIEIVYVRAWTGFLFGCISWRIIGNCLMLNCHIASSKRCSYFWSNILTWCCSSIWRTKSYLFLMVQSNTEQWWCLSLTFWIRE